jgi:hypothetical protein
MISIWDMAYRYGRLPYRYGHPRHRYGIWADDMGDDSIDMVIPDIDIMGCLVTLPLPPSVVPASFQLRCTPREIPVSLAVTACPRCTGGPVYRCTDVPVYRCIGVPVYPRRSRQRPQFSRALESHTHLIISIASRSRSISPTQGVPIQTTG